MQKIFTTTKIIFLIIVSITLTSCGFHLRGEIPLSPRLKIMYLKTASPYGDLANNLRAYLKMSHVQLTDTPEAADTVLQILSENSTQQLLGVSSTQQTRQYNLILSVTFQLTDAKGNIIIIPQTVSETRTLAINTNQILAGSNEATALTQTMRREIVFDIMNKLTSNSVTNILNQKKHRP